MKFYQGFRHTEESKRKIGLASRGNKYALGKHHVVSNETREKISRSLKGKTFSAERKKRLSESLMGRIGPWRGKKRPEIRDYLGTEEVRRKISIGNRKEVHKSDESEIWRKRIEYRLWRESVFARDNWTCRKCAERGGKLHPHHIQNFSSVIELRFAIDNGITFCENCHRLFHKVYGKIRNTQEQVTEYIYGKEKRY